MTHFYDVTLYNFTIQLSKHSDWVLGIFGCIVAVILITVVIF